MLNFSQLFMFYRIVGMLNFIESYEYKYIYIYIGTVVIQYDGSWRRDQATYISYNTQLNYRKESYKK